MDDATARASQRWRYHPARDRLIAEAHARPYVPLAPPTQATRIATLLGEGGLAADRAHLVDLCRRLGEPEPNPEATWCALEAGAWRLRWEGHTEFSTWTFFRGPPDDRLFATTALDLAPDDWIGAWPGEVLVATSREMRAAERVSAPRESFAAGAVGACLNGDAASVFTDFRTDALGFTRFLLLVHRDDPPLLGRLALGLLEMETYRLMALLAFPLAGEAALDVRRIEAEAEVLAGELGDDAAADSDRALLARLASLAGRAEALRARTGFRFSAARAYHEIVRNRIANLREERIDGLQTLGEFMERRLGPAMRTCDTVAQRERDVVDRIARTEQLLNTRVEVAAETTSLALLESMDRRAEVQLKLQRTVESLSVAAISYYAIGLLLYMLGAAKELVPGLSPTMVAGLAAPLVIAVAWVVLRRLRGSL